MRPTGFWTPYGSAGDNRHAAAVGAPGGRTMYANFSAPERIGQRGRADGTVPTRLACAVSFEERQTW
ncbi:hypothetical protein GCM10022207_26250 [Streptomyces lannensis]|uniref:Uncharacterized protein n=1 Tax=Streptomyces lannensis TaxID=766498 RepID=A0ABP7K262_9ACTN